MSGFEGGPDYEPKVDKEKIQSESAEGLHDLLASVDVPSPTEAYERNLEQTSKDVFGALKKFDMKKFTEEYDKQLKASKAYKGKGDFPDHEYWDGHLLSFDHEQEMDMDGKKVIISVSFSSANDDYVVSERVTVKVEGKRYAFEYSYRGRGSSMQESQSLKAKSTVRASGQTTEVLSYSKGESFGSSRIGNTDEFSRPGPFEYGELMGPEGKLLEEMSALSDRVGRVNSKE
jgi:hypothetical protein